MTDTATKRAVVILTDDEHVRAKTMLSARGSGFQEYLYGAIRQLLTGNAPAAEPAVKNEARDAVRERRLQKIEAWLYRDAKKESEGSLSVKLLLAELLEDDDLRRHVRAQAETYYAQRRK